MRKVLASLALSGALVFAVTAASACDYGNQASTASQSADKTAQTQQQPTSANE